MPWPLPSAVTCFTNVSRAIQNNIAKIYNARNHIYGENSKLKLCSCAQSMALGTRTNSLDILIRGTISAIHKFRANILARSWNVSEKLPRPSDGSEYEGWLGPCLTPGRISKEYMSGIIIECDLGRVIKLQNAFRNKWGHKLSKLLYLCSQCWEIIENANTFTCPEINSVWKKRQRHFCIYLMNMSLMHICPSLEIIPMYLVYKYKHPHVLGIKHYTIG